MSVLRRFIPLSILAVSLLLGACAEDADTREQVLLEISYPEAGSFVDESRVRVRGTADGADRVTVNGQTAEVAGGEWDVLVDFEEGPATASASAGEEEVEVDFVVDTVAPSFELTSPERALIVEEGESDEVLFEGRVEDDGSELTVLALDNAAVSYDEDGNFSHTVSLEPGYNEFELRAVDEAGNESSARRAALYGPMADPTSEIDSAAEVEVSPEAFDTTAEVIESLLTPERLTQLAQDSLVDNENIAVDSIDFDSLSVEISPLSAPAGQEHGYLEVFIDITNLQVEGTATISGEDYPATITVDEAAMTTEVTLTATDSGDLDVSFSGSELVFEDEALHFTYEDYSGDDSETLRGIAANAARAAFSDLLSDELFDQLYDPGLLRRQVELLGRTLEFQLVLEQVRTTGDGMYIRAALAIVSDRYDEVRDAPGALELPLGERTVPKIEGDLLFKTHRTAVDRVLHGAWRSGLLHQELVGSDFAGYELPVDLRAGALAAVLDSRISQLDDTDTPVVLGLRPLLPPVAALDRHAGAEESGDSAGDDQLGIQLGELLVDMTLVPEDGEPIEVVSVALFLDLKATFELRDAKLGLGLEADVRADVAEEHDIDFEDEEVEALFVDLISLASEMIGEQMELTAAAELDWMTIDNLQAEIHGEEFDQLSVTADIAANPDAL
ncbi:MAG: hypothetical protein ACLFVJ_08910 [Persicimonas sp.]